MNVIFLGSVFIVNIVLWLSYIYFLKGETNMNHSSLWNNVNLNERQSLLIMAGIAYILNILLALFFAYSKNVEQKKLNIILCAYVSYYVLQLFFLPLLILYTKNKIVKQKNIYKLLIRLLLIIVVIPMFIIMVYCLKEMFYTYTNKNVYTSIIVGLCSILPFLHVLINDAYVFGFTF